MQVCSLGTYGIVNSKVGKFLEIWEVVPREKIEFGEGRDLSKV